MNSKTRRYSWVFSVQIRATLLEFGKLAAQSQVVRYAYQLRSIRTLTLILTVRIQNLTNNGENLRASIVEDYK